MAESPSMRMLDLAGSHLGSRTIEYVERDAILYAIAVGARASDIDLVYEQRLRVMPTFALPLGLWATEEAGRLGAYDNKTSLHLGQELEMHRPLPRAGVLETQGVIAAVWDKGSASLIEVKVSSEYFDATYLLFAPGSGGFGGERGASSSPSPAGDPDLRTRVATTENQAVLYRLTGDLHPLHVDPEVARANGFARPILHGLCTLGAVALEVTRAVGRHPVDLTGLSARFTAPVLPGDAMDVECWNGDGLIAFAATVEGTGKVLSGSVTYV
jgi:acyl dehydratase